MQTKHSEQPTFFDLVMQHIIKRTTMVDATLVKSSRKRPDSQDAASGTTPDAAAS